MIDIDWGGCGESESEDLDYNRSFCQTDRTVTTVRVCGEEERGVSLGADLYTSYCQRQNGSFLRQVGEETRTVHTHGTL